MSVEMVEPCYRLLSLDGENYDDPTDSNVNMADTAYSPGSPGFFWVGPKHQGDRLKIFRFMIYIRDNGVWAADKFGSQTALSNGLQIGLFDQGGNMKVPLSPLLKSNSDIDGLAYDARPVDYGSGDNALASRFSFDKGGQEITMVNPNQRLGILVQDDLSSLVNVRVHAQGKWIDRIYQ